MPNPHSSGSLSLPEMHVPVSESAGREQTVKSALIWLIKSDLGLPQSLGFTAISSSLVAESACRKISIPLVDDGRG